MLKWCQPVLPVLSGARTYIDELGGIALVQRNKVIHFFLWDCVFIKRLSGASVFFLFEWCMRCMFVRMKKVYIVTGKPIIDVNFVIFVQHTFQNERGGPTSA